MNWQSIVTIAAFLLLVVITLKVYFKMTPHSEDFNIVKFMARVAIFGAMSAILYVVPIFTFKLPFFPSFLSVHFDEVPAFICGYAYGPWAAVAVIVIKTLIKLPFTSTMCVGEFADLVLSCAFLIPSTIIYKKHRTMKGFLIGFVISMAFQIVCAMFLNVYVMIPFYSAVMGFKEASLLYVMRLAVPAVSDIKWSYATLCVLPFNALKDTLVFILVFLIYRSLHVFLRMKRA